MLHQVIIDLAVGILLIVGLIIAWNFPNPIGEHDTVKSKLGFNASFEFDLIGFAAIFFTISLICHYWKHKNSQHRTVVQTIHGVSDTAIAVALLLNLFVSTESLYLSGKDELLSNKIFAKFDNDTDREAQMMFWVALLLVSFSQVSFTFQNDAIKKDSGKTGLDSEKTEAKELDNPKQLFF